MMHNEGIAHRGLSPSNIFINSGEQGEFSLKIADFGIRNLINRETFGFYRRMNIDIRTKYYNHHSLVTLNRSTSSNCRSSKSNTLCQKLSSQSLSSPPTRSAQLNLSSQSTTTLNNNQPSEAGAVSTAGPTGAATAGSEKQMIAAAEWGVDLLSDKDFNESVYLLNEIKEEFLNQSEFYLPSEFFQYSLFDDVQSNNHHYHHHYNRNPHYQNNQKFSTKLDSRIDDHYDDNDDEDNHNVKIYCSNSNENCYYKQQQQELTAEVVDEKADMYALG